LAYRDRATGELYIPAHPHEHSFLRLSCGALSVPRKNRLLPLVTAETIACPNKRKIKKNELKDGQDINSLVTLST